MSVLSDMRSIFRAGGGAPMKDVLYQRLLSRLVAPNMAVLRRSGNARTSKQLAPRASAPLGDPRMQRRAISGPGSHASPSFNPPAICLSSPADASPRQARLRALILRWERTVQARADRAGIAAAVSSICGVPKLGGLERDAARGSEKITATSCRDMEPSGRLEGVEGTRVWRRRSVEELRLNAQSKRS